MIRELLRVSWLVVGTAGAIASLPGSIELLILSLASLAPVKRRVSSPSKSAWRVAVIVPAHDEEAGIASCVQSLRLADRGDLDVEVYVIADNCSDATAEVARRGGVRVLERTDPEHRGKGYALHFAFVQLAPLGYDCVLVVDADTEVSQNFVVAAAGVLRHGAAAVQVRYLIRDAEDDVRSRLRSLALRAFNVLRPRGRERLGLSAGILGNGFGLTRETLEAVPYLASSIVEDLEYHLTLVRSGRRVVFADEAAVYGEMPSQGAGVRTQRARWEGGRLRIMIERSPRALHDVLHGRIRLAEPLLELLLLPLGFHVLLIVAAILTPLRVVHDIGLVGAAILLLHVVAAMLVGGGSWRDVTALAIAPFYVLWKITLIPSLMRSARSNQSWIRTNRK